MSTASGGRPSHLLQLAIERVFARAFAVEVFRPFHSQPDPVWADIDHAWVWRDGGSYYGVPISNFFGWFLTTYIFYQLFALYLRNRVFMSLRTSHWRLAILFYAASAAGNLLVIPPVSLGGVFADAAGKHWMIPDVVLASRVVSIFLIMPLSLIAWVKASRSVKPISKQVSLGIPSE
jgi:hypothetical protein